MRPLFRVRVVGLASLALVGAVLGLVGVAWAYQVWWPVPPCDDTPGIGGPIDPACVMPTAPGWILSLGGALGAAIFVVLPVSKIARAKRGRP